MNTVTGTEGSNPSLGRGAAATSPGTAGAGALKESRISVQPGYQAKEWTVLSCCGNGSGEVYKVRNQKTEEIGAMKIECIKKNEESCLLKECKTYQALLKHTLGAKHVVEMLAFEQIVEGNLITQFLIMGFLGPNIKELKEKCGGKFELSTVLRIGIQTLCGIKMIHDVGYVHRHLRPSCFMVGNPDNLERCRLIYVTDFRIARRFLNRSKNNMGIYREEREAGSVRMHGYVRYVSVSVHNGNEHRCRDDIWSWIYILAELLDKLPWQNIKVDPTKIHALKMITPDSQLFSSIKVKDPKDSLRVLGKPVTPLGYLTSILEYIRTVHADSKPDYVGIYRRLKNAANMCGSKFSDPYDWEPMEQSGECFLSEADLQKYFGHEEMQIVRKGDQRVELDPGFFRDNSSPQAVRRAPRIRHNTESLEIPSFLDVDATQHSLISAPSGHGTVMKKTVRKDVAAAATKKKTSAKESGGADESTKKNVHKKVQRKKPSNSDKNVNEDRKEMKSSCYVSKSPKFVADEKEKRREAAATPAAGAVSKTTVPKSAPQMLANDGNNNSSKRKKKEKKKGKKDKKNGDSSRKHKKKKKQFQHKNNDLTVDKTNCTRDESSSESSSDEKEKPSPPPPEKKKQNNTVRARTAKSSTTSRKKSTSTNKTSAGRSETKSREGVQIRKKPSLRRKNH